MSDFTSNFWSVFVTALDPWSAFVVRRAALDGRPQRKVVSASDNTTHVWDGDLGGMNNPLPRWWVWMFIITIIFGCCLPGPCTLVWGSYGGKLGWTAEGRI